jgi:protein-S-isoprenylcysteine O-methyltransferase Ste14
MVLGWAIRNFGSSSLFSTFIPSLLRGKVAFVVLSALILRSIVNRIRSEETMLAAEFGDRWKAYAKRTWRLIPLVW